MSATATTINDVTDQQTLVNNLVETRRQLLRKMEETDGKNEAAQVEQQIIDVEEKLRDLAGTASPGGPLLADGTPEVKKQEPSSSNSEPKRDYDSDEDDVSISEVRVVPRDRKPPASGTSLDPSSTASSSSMSTPKRSYTSLFGKNRESAANSTIIDLTADDDDNYSRQVAPVKRPKIEPGTKGVKTEQRADVSVSGDAYSDRTKQIMNLFGSNSLPSLPQDQISSAISLHKEMSVRYLTVLKRRNGFEETLKNQRLRIQTVSQKARSEPANSENNMILHSLAKSMEITTKQLRGTLHELRKVERQIEIFFSPNSADLRDYNTMLQRLRQGYYDNEQVLWGTTRNNLQQQQQQQHQLHARQQEQHLQVQYQRQLQMQQQQFQQHQQRRQQLQQQQMQQLQHHMGSIQSHQSRPRHSRFSSSGYDLIQVADRFDNSRRYDGYSSEDEYDYYDGLSLTERNQAYETDLRELLDSIPWNGGVAAEDRTGTPEQLKINLLEHQKVGLTWLQNQEKTEARKGGILADDMGLGKTIQML